MALHKSIYYYYGYYIKRCGRGVVNALIVINEVIVHQARLILGWVTV